MPFCRHATNSHPKWTVTILVHPGAEDLVRAATANAPGGFGELRVVGDQRNGGTLLAPKQKDEDDNDEDDTDRAATDPDGVGENRSE